jgi:pimeloyl-ACP methyl ester carboxylesterase
MRCAHVAGSLRAGVGWGQTAGGWRDLGLDVVGVAGVADRARARADPDGVADLAAGPAVLTIFGQYNDPLHFQRRWHELFPHVCQVVIASGNHFPVNDDPQGVAAAIRAW